MHVFILGLLMQTQFVVIVNVFTVTMTIQQLLTLYCIRLTIVRFSKIARINTTNLQPNIFYSRWTSFDPYLYI